MKDRYKIIFLSDGEESLSPAYRDDFGVARKVAQSFHNERLGRSAKVVDKETKEIIYKSSD